MHGKAIDEFSFFNVDENENYLFKHDEFNGRGVSIGQDVYKCKFFWKGFITDKNHNILNNYDTRRPIEFQKKIYISQDITIIFDDDPNYPHENRLVIKEMIISPELYHTWLDNYKSNCIFNIGR